MERNSDRASGERNKKNTKRENLMQNSQIDWRSFEEEGFELFDLEDDED